MTGGLGMGRVFWILLSGMIFLWTWTSSKQGFLIDGWADETLSESRSPMDMPDWYRNLLAGRTMDGELVGRRDGFVRGYW
jgi:hypothetical protein